MSTTAATPRFGLVAPNGDDPIKNGDDLIRAIVAALDPTSGNGGAAKDQQGTFASIGAAGTRGRWYKATDGQGLIYRDNGSSLDPVVAGSAALAKLGLSDDTVVRRGKSIIPTAETRTNTAYGLLTTPDRVQGIVLPTDGWMVVAVQATWQESVVGAARAAIFIGANQIKIAQDGTAAPVTTAAAMSSTLNPNTDTVLSSYVGGLVGAPSDGGVAYTGDVTTGQVIGQVGTIISGSGKVPIVEVGGTIYGLASSSGTIAVAAGGFCLISAAAGTYDVSVQFKASSGSVTAKNRKLSVFTIGF
jgi:hypothetical protein